MEQDAVRVFTENWSLYQKIMRCNYMHHEEFTRETAAIFKEFQKDVHILDIGCGDASSLLTGLKQVQVASYTGYDLSPVMLQLAESNLNAQSFPFVLREGNMMELIQAEEKHFDIIHSSFAIHHLQDKEKRKLLQACFMLLSPGGKMIYIDAFRPQQISRDQYMQDYRSFVERNWTLLEENEKQLLLEHINRYDFPSDIEITIEWLEFLGFSVTDRYQPDQYHAMLVLSGE